LLSPLAVKKKRLHQPPPRLLLQLLHQHLLQWLKPLQALHLPLPVPLLLLRVPPLVLWPQVQALLMLLKPLLALPPVLLLTLLKLLLALLPMLPRRPLNPRSNSSEFFSKKKAPSGAFFLAAENPFIRGRRRKCPEAPAGFGRH
jgi:hypothetical protein